MGESLSKLLGKQGSKHKNNPFVPNQQVKQVTVWESLNAPFREPTWEKKRAKPCTSTPNKRNFPATPKNVFTISHKDFLAICDKQVKELQGITIAEKDLKVFVTQGDGKGQMKIQLQKKGVRVAT